jgi:hypothetical protein
MASDDLFLLYVQSRIDGPLDSREPAYLGGWQVVEALWPLNQRFRPNLEQIRALPYQREFEREADAAIEAMAFERPDADWSGVSAQAWRVLLERQQQGIMLAIVNEIQGNPLMPLPAGFPQDGRTVAAMLFVLYQMPLPFPVGDRSHLELPPGGPPASLRRH